MLSWQSSLHMFDRVRHGGSLGFQDNSCWFAAGCHLCAKFCSMTVLDDRCFAEIKIEPRRLEECSIANVSQATFPC